MVNVIKKLFKLVYFYIVQRVYGLIIRKESGKRKRFPRDILRKDYQLYQDDGLAGAGINNKLVVPYETVNIYNRVDVNRPFESLFIKEFKNRKINEISFSEKTYKCILPICVISDEIGQEGQFVITVDCGGETNNILLKYSNRFHYLNVNRMDKFSKILITSDCDGVIIGEPILQNDNIDNDLVVHIFVDALTQCVVEEFGLDIMPNTKRFFSIDSTYYTNTYAQSEWTLSSVAGIFTGKYTNSHLIYHPRRADLIKDKTLAEQLSSSGYFTYGATNIPKLSPLNAFDRGFKRYIFACNKNDDYLISDAIEQLKSVTGKQYIFIGLFDVHESHTLQSISTQIATSIEDYQFKILEGNSKNTKVLRDQHRINLYKESITSLDARLSRLYSEIEKYDKNAKVVMHSDHGVNFMGSTEELLSKEREKVLFLYKNGKKSRTENNITEIRILPNLILDDLGINNLSNNFNSNYSITESLYPKKNYEIAIRSNEQTLFYKVLWSDVVDGNVEPQNISKTWVFLNDESSLVSKEQRDLELEHVAKQHYIKLIKNIQDSGVKSI